MKILHILVGGAGKPADRIISVQVKSHQVKVVDLSKKSVSYEDLVDEIFSHDKVVTW